MEIEKLLEPRFECVSQYPGTVYKVGKIYTNRNQYYNLAQYPAIFRELYWYEYRDKKDLPKYIVITGDFYTKNERSFGKSSSSLLRKNTVWKVLKWEKSCGKNYYNAALVEGCNVYVWISECKPATKAEFESAKRVAFTYEELDSFPFGKMVKINTKIKYIKK